MKYWLSLLMIPETEQLIEIARIAEEVGFHGVSVADHLVMPAAFETPYPYTPNGEVFWPPETAWADPWITLAAIGAATQRIRLASNIYLAALRDPFTAARAVGTTAILSGGRAVCGLSAGWLREEFELLGIDFASRGRRLDEMIDVLRDLWTGGPVEHHGAHFDFPPVLMRPAPRAAIPIWCGGGSPAALRRAATRCDGWIGLVYTREKLLPVLAELRRLRAEAGRAERPFEVLVGLAERQTPELTRELESHGVTGLMTTAPWLFSREDASSLQAKRRSLERYAERRIHKIG